MERKGKNRVEPAGKQRFQEDYMRSTSLVLAALTGLAVSTFAAPAGAFTPMSSAGVGLAAQSVDPVASVHCRSFKHRSYNHGWGYGCRGGVHVSIHEREGGRVHRRGFEEREGVRARVGVHERSSTRSETNVRSRESTKARGEVRSEGTRSNTTGKSSTTGNRTETGGASGGGSSSGGTSGQSPGGQR
jgi:hypothetical protein